MFHLTASSHYLNQYWLLSVAREHIAIDFYCEYKNFVKSSAKFRPLCSGTNVVKCQDIDLQVQNRTITVQLTTTSHQQDIFDCKEIYIIFYVFSGISDFYYAPYIMSVFSKEPQSITKFRVILRRISRLWVAVINRLFVMGPFHENDGFIHLENDRSLS